MKDRYGLVRKTRDKKIYIKKIYIPAEVLTRTTSMEGLSVKITIEDIL